MSGTGTRVLPLTHPIRPRSTHPPVGPFRCGRTGARVSVTRLKILSNTRGMRGQQARWERLIQCRTVASATATIRQVQCPRLRASRRPRPHLPPALGGGWTSELGGILCRIGAGPVVANSPTVLTPPIPQWVPSVARAWCKARLGAPVVEPARHRQDHFAKYLSEENLRLLQYHPPADSYCKCHWSESRAADHSRSQARAASRSVASKWRTSAWTKCLAICGAIERMALSETAATFLTNR